jgi:hypothetical protein
MAGIGTAEDDDDQHEINRHQHRMLGAEKDQTRPWRQFIDGVDQIFRPRHGRAPRAIDPPLTADRLDHVPA